MAVAATPDYCCSAWSSLPARRQLTSTDRRRGGVQGNGKELPHGGMEFQLFTSVWEAQRWFLQLLERAPEPGADTPQSAECW
jgi:hypothetical protein